jgi:hypothetical protein
MRSGWVMGCVMGSVLLWAVMVTGCQRGGGSEAVSQSPRQAVPAKADVPVAADAVEPADAEQSAKAEEAAEWTGDEVFTGTNLLAGVWAELREQTTTEPADNSYCYVCHANYRDEDLTKFHQPVGVGCELCHGMSDEHSADEDGLTAPEIMWPKAWINVTCMECHPYEELEREHAHGEFLAKPLPEQVCTDCHGEHHRLSVRTRVWDRKTGRLTACDGVRMMDADSPAGAAR